MPTTERHGDGDGEAGAAAHAAQRVANVGDEIVEPARAASVAHGFALVIESAEGDERAAAGFVGRDSGLTRRSVSISTWKRNSSSMRDSALFVLRIDRVRADSALNRLIALSPRIRE